MDIAFKLAEAAQMLAGGRETLRHDNGTEAASPYKRFPTTLFAEGETRMKSKTRQVCVLAALFALVTLCAVQAREAKPTDEGKGAEFKGKTFEMKDKGEAAILLAFAEGKEVEATTKGEKETDVHLFVYDQDGKEIGKDTSPGPKCSVKFKPAKDGKFKLLVKNAGGTNKVTLEVKVAK